MVLNKISRCRCLLNRMAFFKNEQQKRLCVRMCVWGEEGNPSRSADAFPLRKQTRDPISFGSPLSSLSEAEPKSMFQTPGFFFFFFDLFFCLFFLPNFFLEPDVRDTTEVSLRETIWASRSSILPQHISSSPPPRTHTSPSLKHQRMLATGTSRPSRPKGKQGRKVARNSREKKWSEPYIPLITGAATGLDYLDVK